MKPTATITTEPAVPSSRRQPLRKARTNHARNMANSTRPLGDQGSIDLIPDSSQIDSEGPGFYPAITHFTKSVAALPKEVIRHYTLLKEVDAKIFGPEAVLARLINQALTSTTSPQKINSLPLQTSEVIKVPTETPINDDGTRNDRAMEDVVQQIQYSSVTEDPPESHIPDFSRRALFTELRSVMSETLMTLDEKNHVLSTTIKTLNKQLARCESSFKYIDHEVSEESRHGNLNHWAYRSVKAPEKKGTTAGERTRRDVAAASNLAATTVPSNDGDAVASRTGIRREALAARKRNKRADSEFEEAQSLAQSAAVRRTQGNAKIRKLTEQPASRTAELGISNGRATQAPNKRRRIEKSQVNANLSMGKPISVNQGANGGSGRGVGWNDPRSTPVLEGPKKRTQRPTTANGGARRRADTTTVAAESPPTASSPVVNVFSGVKDSHHSSPAPLAQGTQASRARQNSTQSIIKDARHRPSSSTSNKGLNGNESLNSAIDIDKGMSIAGRVGGDLRASTKAGTKPIGGYAISPGDLLGAQLDGGTGNDGNLKFEDTEITETARQAHRPPSISTSHRGAAKSSKTSTPINPSFSEPPRARRPEPAAKRSHKKGAGLAAQLAAAAAAEEDGSSMQGDDEDEDNDDEPRYCYCNQVSYGEMVACDGESCAREWFHLDCVGLAKAPKDKAKWYCDDCKEKPRKGKLTGGR